MIWNYCQPLTLIGVEVNVVLGEKKKNHGYGPVELALRTKARDEAVQNS